MDLDLARRWNEVVNDGDLVYHLGDFAMGDPSRWPSYRSQLRGKIVLVRGNHDRYLSRVVDKMQLASVVENVVVTVEGVRCWLNHYPPTPDHRGLVKRPVTPEAYDVALCGHVHNAWRVAARVVNVGVDVWGFRPIGLRDLLEARSQREGDLP
jgi:calcineurin-like phosphoesterase family protein